MQSSCGIHTWPPCLAGSDSRTNFSPVKSGNQQYLLTQRARTDCFLGNMNSGAPFSLTAVWAVSVLFVTGLIAGFVDSIAGGGGLITLPVLLNLGIPPAFAFGTNKLQASFGSGSATWHFAQSKVVSLRECGLGVLFTVIGAAAGTLLVQHLDPAFLKKFVPLLLLAIAAFMIFKPQLGEKDIRPRMTPRRFYVGAGLL